VQRKDFSAEIGQMEYLFNASFGNY